MTRRTGVVSRDQRAATEKTVRVNGSPEDSHADSTDLAQCILLCHD